MVSIYDGDVAEDYIQAQQELINDVNMPPS